MKENIQSLTTIRAIACLSVVVGHSATYTSYSYLWSASRMGVMLLFCLSGFLMTYLYSDYHTLSDWKKYMIRRFFRIYPLYAVSVVLVVLYLTFSAPYSGFELAGKDFNLLHMLTFKSAPWVLWSVRVEIFFYIIFPLLISCIFFLRRYFSEGNIVFILILLMLFLHDIPYQEQLAIPKDGRMDRFLGAVFRTEECFLTGMIAGYIYKMYAETLQKYSYHMAWICIAALLVYLACSSKLFWNLFIFTHPDYSKIVLYYYALPLSVMMSVFILSAAVADRWLGFIFHNKILLFLGKVSFGIYLMHDIFLRRFLNIKWPGIELDTRIIIAWLLTFCAAYALHILIELPYINYARKITAKPATT